MYQAASFEKYESKLFRLSSCISKGHPLRKLIVFGSEHIRQNNKSILFPRCFHLLEPGGYLWRSVQKYGWVLHICFFEISGVLQFKMADRRLIQLFFHHIVWVLLKIGSQSVFCVGSRPQAEGYRNFARYHSLNQSV